MITGNGSGVALLEPGVSENVSISLRSTRAVALITIYIILLAFLPSALVWSPLGGSGGPANMFAAALLAWYILQWLQPRAALARGTQPIRTAAILFACAGVASYVSANRHALPLLERNAADRALISLAGCLAVLLLAADGLGRWQDLHVVLGRIVNCVTVLAAVGITQFVTGLNVVKYISIPGLITKVSLTDLSIRDGFDRPSATTAHPLEFAAVLALCLPLALHRARFAAPGRRAGRWLQVALITGALPMTISRSAVLGLGAVALTLLPTWPKRQRRIAYLFMAGSIGLLWVAVPSVLTVFQHLFAQIGSESSSQSRVNAYSSAVPFISQHPWFGRGLHTFLPQTYFFVDNQYLISLIETGFAGLLTLLALFATGWFAARSARRVVRDVQTRDLLQSLAGSVAAGAVSFATFDALSFTIATGLTFLLLGCVGAAWRLVRIEQRSSVPG